VFVMDTTNSTNPKSAWKGRLIKFIVYVAIGFLCAFLYKQLKN